LRLTEALAESTAGTDYNRETLKAVELVHAGEHEAVRKIIKKYTAGYAAVSDYPNTVFLLDLLELYPGAKVVPVQRDPVSWWRSVEHVAKHVTTPVFSPLTWTTSGLRD
jgi:hypothetical protein